MYPRLEINLRKLSHNVRLTRELLASKGVSVMGVNKVFGGRPETAQLLVDAGITVVAESRVSDLKKIEHLSCLKCLLRSPGFTEIADTVRYADISLNSEIAIMRALSAEAVSQRRQHQILLMIDMGDLREGLWFTEFDTIAKVVDELKALPNLAIYGLGTNFTCYAGTLPSEKNMNQFVEIAKTLESVCQVRFPYLSGGHTTSFHLLHSGQMPKEINQLRIGAMHQFGIEYLQMEYLDGFFHSTKDVKYAASPLFKWEAEIIELSQKPTVPVGEQGLNAFMTKPEFTNHGIRARAIANFGRKDVPNENCVPSDDHMKILGQSSDHTLVDIQDVSSNLKVGDVLSFELDYTGLLLACSNRDDQIGFTYE